MWALAAGSALFWGLKLFARAPAAPPQTELAVPGAGLRGDLTRLLGVDPPPPVVVAAPAAPPPDARFALIGVVSPRPAQAVREGVALIAVDGKPARAYRVGAAVEGETILKSVSARGATLGPRQGSAEISLNLAPPAPAQTGNLPGLAPDAVRAPMPQRPVAVPLPYGRPAPAPRPATAQATDATAAQESTHSPADVTMPPSLRQ